MTSSPPLLEVVQISKAFPGVQALDRVSLTLYPGEVLAVIGENGAGKSTLMKILGGVYTPDEGQLFLDGQHVYIDNVNDAMRLGISLIHQELNLAENLSAAANIFLGREYLFGGPLGFLENGRMQAEARRLMDQVGLECSPNTIVGNLSPGRRQLVEIARALSLKVRILIMDEPTSSLTQSETKTLYEVIRDLRSKGVSIVYISHRLAEVQVVADRVVVLRDGRNAGELTREGNTISDDKTSEAITKKDSPSRATTERNIAEAITREVEEHRTGEFFDPAKSPALERSPIQGISHETMVRLMVGRELNQFFQRKHTPKLDRVRLEINSLCYAGVQGVPHGLSEPITLQIHAGEILGMAGLVGAGRTEFAEAIFGLRPVLAGHILLDGHLVFPRNPHQAIAAGILLVPEDRRYHGLILQDTIKRNLSLPNLDQINYFRLISRTKEKTLAETACQQLRVRTPSIHQVVGLLSGGNQQKVVLGKWLARKPKVLIVDEPTRGVDVGAKSEIYALMDQLAGTGVAILMISSDLEEILGMSDRVAVLHQGELAGVIPRSQLSEEAVMQLATGGRSRP